MDTQTNIQFEPMPEQSNQIVTFNYEGTPISFNRGDAVMVNATEMAKPFGKLPKDFLVNKSTKELIDTLSAVRKIPLTELVVVNQGGNIQGTWMHEDVAMEFKRWVTSEVLPSIRKHGVYMPNLPDFSNPAAAATQGGDFQQKKKKKRCKCRFLHLNFAPF